ncbi:MAG: CHAT domain-containing protein [Candidatus Electrothrix aestuarii]|uniref:CHAT domain-containing protein n=1 Tax=Candidatus Electrothrix aestuarii TaxID=3062594 RepID=A0AAU8LS94_9BACT|nr:CHAT domain-containing protein [Candidatus Electrothrix aestuarii]
MLNGNQSPHDRMNTDKKVLIFSANPKDTSRLRLNKEVREIQDKLSRAKDNRQFTVTLAPAARIHDLQRELLEHEPDIVHFCGHGEEEGILVEDEQGKAVLVPSNALASLFALCAEHVECVFLNSCHSHVQAEAISQHIPYVIGMQKAVGDDASVEFAAGFYNALGFGKSIEQAFAFGKNAVQLYDLPDHLTPILTQRRVKAKPPEKIVLLSADPLDEPQNWNPYIEQIKKKTSCPIEQQCLNIENINRLQKDAYLLILSKIIKNKLLIENEYLCKDTISFKQLDENIDNRQLAGLFLFVDQLPEEKSTAGLTLPTFVLPVENKNHLNTVLYQLFTRKNIDCDNRSRVLNKAAFHLSALNGKSHFNHERTNLPDSIDRQKLKGFVGRSDDLKHICSALMDLDQGKFLTVKGSGGIGKTHTVKKIAVALADRALFPGGIYFIDCEPVTDSKQFQFKAAAVFGLELAEDLWQHLRDHHDQQERLVIFDNFEPLLYLEEEQEIKTILSRMADYAKVLVTSREVLGLEGETVHQMRRLTTDEAAELFMTKFPVPEQQMDFLRQDILSRQLDNNPLAIKLVTGHLPKGKSLDVLREELEEKLFSKVCVDELEIFDSGPDSNIERMDSIYASILYSYRRLNEQEQTAFELLSLFPDGIDLEEFKRLTRKDKKQKKLPPLLITDHLVKSLSDKSMIENSGGHLKLQSMIGRFAQAMLKQREDIAPLYRNAFAYNYRLAFTLMQIRFTFKEKSVALDIFSSQQGNFLAAIKNFNQFEINTEEALQYLYFILILFTDICSLNSFAQELSGKIGIFQGKEKQCAHSFLLSAKYFNGQFSQAVAELQTLIPLDQIDHKDRSIISEQLLIESAYEIYEMEGEALWAAGYGTQQHFPSPVYPHALLDLGEYNSQLAEACRDDFFTFEVLANLGQLPLERIDVYLAKLHEKNHIERMQTSYTRAKLEPLPKKVIDPLVIVNPYTRGLKNLMLAFIEEDAEKADELYQDAADHLWHIRYYHVECLYFYAKFLQQMGDARFEDVHQEGLKLSQKHHYRFLQYRFEELIEPSDQPYDPRNYPLPDNQDFSEYINFLIKKNQKRNSMKGKVQRGRG